MRSAWYGKTLPPAAGRYRNSSRGLARRKPASGFTLVELLVAMSVTLILILALSQTFAMVGDTVSKGRANIELTGNLRSVCNRLQSDFDGLTCPVRPWIDSSQGLGYFEYLEGAMCDASEVSFLSLQGDVDDVLMFTCRSPEAPFVGRVQAEIVGGAAGTFTTITSPVAEVLWWTQQEPISGRFRIHRRVLLVRPDLGTLPTTFNQNESDLSVHWNSTTQAVANSLADLTLRRNRFAHEAVVHSASGFTGDPRAGFPHLVARVPVTIGTNTYRLFSPNYVQSGTRVGEDVLLSDVLAFDVQAYDPNVEVRVNNGENVLPSDPGWSSTAATAVGYGGYVDLNYSSYLSVAASSVFSGRPHYRSQLFERIVSGTSTIWLPISTYDTWAWDYEHDGINQDVQVSAPDVLAQAPQGVVPSGLNVFDTLIDEGVNGLDDDNQNGVDDPGERETSPPYPVPLRGIQVKIRVYEPDSRQVRQASVVANFTPE